jgi:hypothetical protein
VISIAAEAVQQGEKGRDRYRTDKRVKKYLLAKRPRPGDDRLLNYRTECCVGHWEARRDGAEQDILDFIGAEHDWAVEELMKFIPEALLSLGYDVPFSKLQGDLFGSSDTSSATTTEK